MATYPSMSGGLKTDSPLGDLPADSDIAVAAELGRRAAEGQGVDIEGGLVVRVVRKDERIEVVDLEHTLVAPHMPRGEATIYEPADFVAYVNRLADAGTTLWADPRLHKITAVFDDHAGPEAPGWRRHRAVLAMLCDDEWSAWANQNGKLASQEGFAEFLEDHQHSVIDPDSATMLEIATSFQARRNASFERGTRLASGDVQLRWVEDTKASAGTKGHLEVPEQFTVRLAPYIGVAPVELKARLRWRIHDGSLRIGYVLLRPDIAQREAFDRIRALVIEHVKSPMHLGFAPPQLHPGHNPAF